MLFVIPLDSTINSVFHADRQPLLTKVIANRNQEVVVVAGVKAGQPIGNVAMPMIKRKKEKTNRVLKQQLNIDLG